MKEDDEKKNHLSPNQLTNGTTPSDGGSSPVPSKLEDEDLPISKRIRLYTKQSWEKQVKDEKEHQRKLEKNDGKAIAHLVDGELKFEDDEEEAKIDKDPALVEGNLLPEELADVFRDDYYGKPVEEIDRFIKDKTFIAVASRFKKKYIYRFTAQPALFLLRPWNPVRKFAIRIATNQFFDYLVITTILCNCIFLAMPGNPAAETAEYVFLGIYSIECIIKILARGLIIHKYTYLRDPWNWLDFVVIVSAYVTIIIELSSPAGGSSVNLQSLRTFRVFRALKTVAIIPGLKTLVGALLRAFKLLLEVIMLITFCLMVFALTGLQVYQGMLRHKCVQIVPAYTSTPSLSYAQYYNDWIKDSSHWYLEDGADDYHLCGNSSGAGPCPSGYICLPDVGPNPRWGYVSFDNFGWAMLTSFQLITLDFWEDCYDKVIRAGGPAHVLFFTPVVFFGSFYLINLMLAVVAMSYEEEAVTADKPDDEEDEDANEKEKEKEQKEKEEKEEKERKEKEKDPINNIAVASKAAAKWKPNKEKSNLSQSNGSANMEDNKDQKDKVGTDSKSGTVTINGKTYQKHGKGRNPMVKLPSKDSGYSVQSQGSSQSGGSKDTPRDDPDSISLDSDSNPRKADSGTGSMSHGLNMEQPASDKKKKGEGTCNTKFFLNSITPRQRSNSNNVRTITVVSSSGIHLEKGSHDDLDYSSDEENGVPKIKVIVGNKDSGEPEKDTLINRNCACCQRCCMCWIPWLKIQARAYTFASDPLFELFITISIILNTTCMAMTHHNQPDALTEFLAIANYVFTIIFTFEAIVKLVGTSKFYFYNGWNNFDFFIVVVSLIEIATEGIDLPSLSVFRTFRLLRVFKLAQSWPTMRLLLTIILSTLGALGNLTIILGIIIYIFAVIGLQLFGDKYTEAAFDGDGVPRWNFNDFYHAIVLVFRVLCGEWIEPLWDCMRAADELCMVVFLPTLVFGNFIVLNLFLALLLSAFASDSISKSKDEQEENKLLMAFVRIKNICCCCCKFGTQRTSSVGPDDVDDTKSITSKTSKSEDEKAMNGSATKDKSDKSKKDEPHANGTVKKATDDTKKKDQKSKKEENNKKDDDVENAFSAKRDQYSSFDTARKESQAKKKSEKNDDDDDDETKEKKSPDEDEDEDGMKLGDEASTIDQPEEIKVNDCLPNFMMKRFIKLLSCATWEAFDESKFGQKWYNFRRIMVKVVESKAFEYFILALIILSSLSLAFEDIYLYDRQELSDALYYTNIVFVSIFTLEMVLKWFALGFKVYFTSFWTLLDFAIVIISISSLIAEASGAGGFSAFRAMRTLRAFRPLRAISRWQSMRIVVNALMLAIPAIANVLVVCLVFWLIFSIMGVQFFSGRFYKCIDSSGERVDHTIVANKSQCLAMASTMNYTWQNSDINFDNVMIGYLALFQVATFEGWMEVMEDAVDAAGIDNQPRDENQTYAYLYFIVFIIFGAFFTLNLIIGVIIDNFNVLKKKYEGSYLDMFLTTSQRNYMNTLKKLGNKKPQKTIRRPKNAFQAVMYDVSVSPKFDIFIVLIIFLNMIAMAVDHYNMSQYIKDITDTLNIIFTTVFTLECIVKIIGLRHHYFRQPWNVFDFVVVIFSVLGIILQDLLSDISLDPTLLRVVRVFRIGRVLRLIKSAKGIRKLLFALIISLPALINIGALLLLIMYIYAIIGMSTFGNVKLNSGLNDIVNFQTFASSFVLLLRLATSAGWNEILDPLLISEPDCDPDFATRPDGTKFENSGGDCGNTFMAILFMTSYIFIIFLVIINMYIAVILENFNQAHEAEELGITEDDFDEFYVVWEKYDPLATQFIKYEQLAYFVGDLDKPLGIPRPNEIALVAFDLPIVEGDKIHCLDVLIALCKNVLGKVEETKEFKELKSQMESKFQETFPTRVNTNKTSSTMQKKKEDVAAKTLQRAWRSYKTQRQLRNITKMALQKAEADENEKNSKTRGASLFSLGRRLSSALSNFFSSSRPTSAMSRLSVKSTTNDNLPGNGKQKTKSTLQVPQVGSLYTKEGVDNDIEL